MSSVEEELPDYLCVDRKYEEEGFYLAEEMRRVALGDGEVEVKVEEEEFEGLLDPMLRAISREEVEVKEEEDEFEFDGGLLDPALRTMTQYYEQVEVKQEEEGEYEIEGLRDTEQDDTHYEDGILHETDESV